MTTFVGRSRELIAIDALLAKVAAGRGRCLLVSGEAGVGKSRLVQEARRKALAQGFVVLDGHCEPPDAGLAYAGVASLLRNYLRSLKTPGEAAGAAEELAENLLSGERRQTGEVDGGGQQLHEAVAAWIMELASSGLMVTLEDIHWCDEASLACLAAVWAQLAEAPALLVISLRKPHPAPAQEGCAENWFVEAAPDRLHLEPLSLADVSQVLKSLSGRGQVPPFYYLKHVFDLTGGNPLFVEELGRSSTATDVVSLETDLMALQPRPQATIPRSIRRIIGQRLQTVSAEARMVAGLCAAHGRTYDLTLLKMVTELPEERLRARCLELCRAQLAMEMGNGEFAFRHALLREALYELLLVRERRRLHERLMLGLEKLCGPAAGANLAALSYHAYQGGSWRRALKYCRMAAEDALALNAPQVAVTQLARAIEAADWAPDASSWELHCLRAQALEQLGECDRALTDYALALDSARSSGDGEAEARVWRALQRLLPVIRAKAADKHFNSLVDQANRQGGNRSTAG